MKDIPLTAAGCLACLRLLDALRADGMRRLVLCPGSRSGPLAVAASLLEPRGLTLYTAIDERSAAFFALGLARADGTAVAVVTTSGSAVANLLPALVEADQGAIPLLLLTADRPSHLKGCGANQTVNQEAFLQPCCRWVGQGAPEGLAAMEPGALESLAREAMAAASGPNGLPAGPVHLNLPLEEPLHASDEALTWLHRWPTAFAAAQPLPAPAPETFVSASTEQPSGRSGEVLLDPDQPGIVVAGPWRGERGAAWAQHLNALHTWQTRSGWPVLADALSGLRGLVRGPVIAGYDLMLEGCPGELAVPQVLRLGPLPASRRLQTWLAQQRGAQVLVSEADPRPLDPLKCVQGQWSGGLASWPALALRQRGQPSQEALALSQHWLSWERQIQTILNQNLNAFASDADTQAINEPWLARRLSQLLPSGLAVMLANSSPVRDWESFSDPDSPPREIFSFRGASGIDGTLSIACGLAERVGKLVLVSGDLALQHDSNGWLWGSQLTGQLLVVVIDNGGGGIFEQLPIRPSEPDALDMERLFAMPQRVDACALAAAYGVPSREVCHRGDLKGALAWGLAQPLALLRVVSDRQADAAWRRQLRTMAKQLFSPR